MLVDALAQLTFAVHARLTAVAARHDLSITQLRLLGILRDRQPAMLELARVLELEKSSVSGLIDRAEARGLVTRVASREDGRGVHVRLTPKGRALAKRLEREVADELDALVAPLPARDRDRLAGLATQLAGNPS